jgi:WD40-like Beta Propeller Repeat
VRVRAAAALAAGTLLLAAPSAQASAPSVAESWVESVTATSAKLRARINPGGPATTYRFEYVTQTAFEKSGYANAAKAPPSGAAALGGGMATLAVSQSLIAPLNPLTPATAYRYRVVASNSEGTTTAPEHVFATQDVALTFRLPDQRGWEMVSPIDKGGGAIAPPEAIHGGGDLQASRVSSATGAAITYGSATSFGGGVGAPPISQYLSRRTPSGWVTQNVSAPLASAAYGDDLDGAPYRVFSADLSQGLLFGGLPCRGSAEGCPAPNPVLPGSGAPSGYMAYYLRSAATGSFASLLKAGDLAHTSVSPEAFEVSFAAASPDLSRVVLSSCAALTANATEVLSGPGECDPEEQNLYERGSSGLSLINLLPGEATATPGAQIGAVSANGSRVYWTHGGNLYLRDGAQSTQVDETQGGGGSFQAASSDGSVAFFTKAGHLYRFLAATKVATDLTPSGGVVGVLAVSEDGAYAYYQDASGLQRWHEGTTTMVATGAAAAAPSNYPPPTGTSRISPDGQHLAFLSARELTGYDNAGQIEAYLYGPPPGGGAPQLNCASCNPTGERPLGTASIPGITANGSTHAYKPRALSENGSRLFFSSSDELVVQDSNGQPDVYQWEARGVGDCTRLPGCVSLISSGRDPEGATFIDASADGTDAYFITAESLLSIDPGSIDLYDARAGGGFFIPPKPIPCIADACQSLPPTPEDPDPGTLVKNSGNPQQSFFVEKKQKPKRQKKKKHGKGKRKLNNGKGKYHVPLEERRGSER